METEKIIFDNYLPAISGGKLNTDPPFIVANTHDVTLNDLMTQCIVPVFAKDNEATLPHNFFVAIVHGVANKVFGTVTEPQIRVSHEIKGRIPSAIHKPAKELLEHEKTMYYERMMFNVDIPNVLTCIDGNTLNLSVGGVRAYNLENLYSRKSLEKFKVYIGFKNKVCSNMCISTDGYQMEFRVSTWQELQEKVTRLFENYNADNDIKMYEDFTNYELNESQFAQLIGKSKLYHYLPKKSKNKLPELLMNDTQINQIAKTYYHDENFANDNGNINLWKLYNLFTGANKSSYIDSFIDRGTNASSFVNHIRKSLEFETNSWFLK